MAAMVTGGGVGAASALASGAPTAAAGSLEGRVTAADQRPLAGARIDVAARSTTSDADGRFSFPSLPAGRHALRAELAGFGRRDVAVEVPAGDAARVLVELPFLPFTETVVVSATRGARRLAESPVDVTVLTRHDLERAPAAALDDVLKQVPSFSLFRRTSSQVSHPTTQGVSLRGVGASGASRTLVIVDGVPHNDAFGNWVSWASVPLLQVESIEVAPSGLSSLYGSSAMAGVIRVESQGPKARTAAARSSVGSRGIVDAEAFGSHVRGKLGAGLGAGLFQTDGYRAVRAQDRGAVDVAAASRHRTGNWRLEYGASPGLTLFHSGRVFAEDRENGTPLTTNSTREVQLAAGVRASTPGGQSFAANVFARRNRFQGTFSAVAADRASESLSLAQAVDSDDLGGHVQWSRPLGRSSLVTVGGDARLVEAEDRERVYIAPAVHVRNRVIPARQLLAGIYAQQILEVRPVVVTLGARVDHWRNSDASQAETVTATGARTVVRHPEVSETAVSPRAGILLNLAAGWALRGAVHGGFRAPSLNELYRPFRVGNVLTQGNPALGRERLIGAEAGVNHAPTARFSWRATAFLDEVRDPIANLTLSTTPALITRQRTNLGRARVRGLSADADYRPGPRLRVRGSYALTDARVTAFPATPELEGNVLPQVPRHRATLGVDHPGAQFTASVTARFESARFDDDQNRLRLGRLFVADLALGRSLSGSWEVFVAAENLIGTRYAVQATPVDLLGTPFTLTAGLRFDLRPDRSRPAPRPTGSRRP